MNRFSEVEELVYLRWVNACLRFELRNYKGMSEALTLNASLSPRSQEKAKGLMMEYAYPQRSLTASENGDESEVSVSGSESEPPSLDRAAHLTTLLVEACKSIVRLASVACSSQQTWA